MKLNNKNKKKRSIALIVGGIFLIVIVAIMFILPLFSAPDLVLDEKEIIGLKLSIKPNKTVYYVGEQFDPTGASVQVVTRNIDYSYFVDASNLRFSGFDSSVANDALTITVTYKEYSTSFTVQIVEKPSATPMLSDIEIVGFKTNYTMTEWNAQGPQVTDAIVKLIYDNGAVDESVLLQKAWIYGAVKVSEPCTLDLTIKYNSNGQVFEKVVTVTITK